MDKRIKGTFIIISVLFLLIAGITTKCVLFYDEENLNALSDQYYRVVDTVYPRGVLMTSISVQVPPILTS